MGCYCVEWGVVDMILNIWAILLREFLEKAANFAGRKNLHHKSMHFQLNL